MQYALTGFVIARKAFGKLFGTVAFNTRSGTGFVPAPTIARMPHNVIEATLNTPSQLSRPRVRGRAKRRVAMEKISRNNMAHNPLSDREDKASCPDSSSDP